MLVNKNELSNLLDKAYPFIMTRSFAPILTHFCFDSTKVTAYNDLQAIEVKYKNNIECAIPAALLIKMLNSISGNDVEIVKKMDEIIFKSGRTKMSFPTLPKEDFIFTMPDIISCQKISLPLDVIDGLASCLVSISQDLSSPEKSGVRLIIDEGKLEFYSIDGITVSRYKYESPNIMDNIVIDVIIPSTFCEQLIRLIKAKPTDNEDIEYIDLYVSEDEDNLFLIAEIDENTTIFTRLIDVDTKTDFVNLIGTLENKFTSFIEVTKELENIISRACILVSPEDKMITKIESKDKTIFFDTLSKSGRSDDSFEVATLLESGRFQVDPEILNRVLPKMTHICISYTSGIIACKSCNGNFLHLISTKAF
jgi:DNA polymerase III sliding clamp (beta) subunit (PCNA family)